VSAIAATKPKEGITMSEYYEYKRPTKEELEGTQEMIRRKMQELQEEEEEDQDD
jgi:hypothetical protein